MPTHRYINAMRILLIEDDADIRSVVQRGLQAEGFDVDTASNGDDGLDQALNGGYAAIILDLLLPGRNGYSVCDEIRGAGLDVPILVVTAKSGELDQIDLLDGGADDFLTKPVSIGVLLARVRVLLRRGGSIAINQLERGPLSYDLATRECVVDERAVVLTNREDQLLRLLLLANGACVPRLELFDQVWGSESGIDASNLDIYLRRLREKLAPTLVENVRGIGYRIAVNS